MGSRRFLAAVAAVWSVMFFRVSAQPQPSDTVRSPTQDPAQVEEYWTKDRMENAKPLRVTIPTRRRAEKTKSKSRRIRQEPR